MAAAETCSHVRRVPRYRRLPALPRKGLQLGRNEGRVVRRQPAGRKRGGPRVSETLEPGQKVRDANRDLVGVVLDRAGRYLHPRADPITVYLIRWDNGLVEALSEAAFQGDWGIHKDR